METQNPNRELFRRLLRRYRRRLLLRRWLRLGLKALVAGALLGGLAGILGQALGADANFLWIPALLATVLGWLYFARKSGAPQELQAALHADAHAKGRGELPLVVEGKAKAEETFAAALATLQRALLGRQEMTIAPFMRWLALPAIAIFVIALALPRNRTKSSPEKLTSPTSAANTALDTDRVASALAGLRQEMLATNAAADSASNEELASVIEIASKKARAELAAAASLKEGIEKNNPQAAQAARERLQNVSGNADLPEFAAEGGNQALLEAADKIAADARARLAKLDHQAATLALVEGVGVGKAAEVTGLGKGGEAGEVADVEPQMRQPIRLSASAWGKTARPGRSGFSSQKRASAVMSGYREALEERR